MQEIRYFQFCPCSRFIGTEASAGPMIAVAMESLPLDKAEMAKTMGTSNGWLPAQVCHRIYWLHTQMALYHSFFAVQHNWIGHLLVTVILRNSLLFHEFCPGNSKHLNKSSQPAGLCQSPAGSMPHCVAHCRARRDSTKCQS